MQQNGNSCTVNKLLTGFFFLTLGSCTLPSTQPETAINSDCWCHINSKSHTYLNRLRCPSPDKECKVKCSTKITSVKINKLIFSFIVGKTVVQRDDSSKIIIIIILVSSSSSSSSLKNGCSQTYYQLFTQLSQGMQGGNSTKKILPLLQKKPRNPCK